jgi:hypothetical protein
LRRIHWRRVAALVAMLALALNVTLGALCHCAPAVAETFGIPICAHHDDSGGAGGQQQPFDDDGACCKCCRTLAFNVTAAAPALPLPTPVEWRKPAVVVIADRPLPAPRRHILESPRGPPLA